MMALSKEQQNKMVEYESGGQTVKLSPNTIRQFLVSGGGNVSDQEVVMFLNLCKYQKLNPFLREAYLIKYGNAPASMVTGKDVFTKRARKNKDYAGQQAGVIVMKEENMNYRTGALVLPDETLIGGWAKVYIKGYEVPIEAAVAFGEYVGRKKDGETNGQWKSKPATMIRKVALVQALREAFPEDFQGLYSQEEMGLEVDETAPLVIEEKAEIEIEEVVPSLEEQMQSDFFGDDL